MFYELTLTTFKHNNELHDKMEYSRKYNKYKSEKSAKKSNSTCSSSFKYRWMKNDEEELGMIVMIESDLFTEDIQVMRRRSHSCYILNFPVQIICLEKLENTLDYLYEKTNEISNNEWKSCLFQIIMMLITYQKVFDFTHNDLHTNNIMYINTDKKFINYKYQ